MPSLLKHRCALDFSGVVAALIQGPADDVNLEVLVNDLSKRHTRMILMACRDNLPGTDATCNFTQDAPVSILDPTEVNEGASDDLSDDAGSVHHQAPPAKSLAAAHPRVVVAPDIGAWEGLNSPPSDLMPPVAQLPPFSITVPACDVNTEYYIPYSDMKDFFCPGFGLPFPIENSQKVILWVKDADGHCRQTVYPFPCVLSKKSDSGMLTRFQRLKTGMGMKNKAFGLEFQHLGSSPPPPGRGVESERIYHLSVKKIEVDTDYGSKKAAEDVRATPANAWAGMTAPPADLTPPAAQVPPGRIFIPAHRKSNNLNLPSPFIRDFVAAATGVPFPLQFPIKAWLWAEGPSGCRGFSAALGRSLSVTINSSAERAEGFEPLGDHLGVHGASEASELEFRHLGFAAAPGRSKSDRVHHFSVRKCNVGSAAAPRAQTAAQHGELVPPVAAVPPTRVYIPSRYTVGTITLGKDFMTDFFCPGTGVPYPLENSVDLCLWAEGPSGRTAFYRKLSIAGDNVRISFKPLGEHLRVYNISNAATLEFMLLGSSPASPGRPVVYHLSVKKVRPMTEYDPGKAVARSPAKKHEALPTPALNATPPPAKKTRAPPALSLAAASPLKKPKSMASVPPPMHVPPPAPAVANMQLAQPAQPDSSAPVSALHPLLLKVCAQQLKDAEDLAREFRDAPEGLPPSDSARQQRLDRASLDVAVGRAQELWPNSGIYVAQGIHGLLDSATPEWCAARVPPLSRSLLDAPQLRKASVSESLASVLQGKPPYKLWVGPVGGGDSKSEVVTLEYISPGSWVLQVPGKYVFGTTAVQAAGHPTARFIPANGGGVCGGGCIAPLAAAATPEQLNMCLSCATGRHHNDSDPKWRRLGDTALDFSGTIAAFIQGPAADANLDVVDVDLPTGPTGTFLVACRDILPGERLVAALH